ncbi:MAG: phospholipid carrier-dependent glycosyltransferase, partial [Patescibacteria group bacterium]
MILKTFLKKNWVILTLIFIVVASFLLRIWQLGKIGDQIFDEVYFVKFAENYLSGVSFFDIHPPLGKLIIASALFFHNTSFTWRIMPAIFGTLLIILGYFTGKELSSKIAGLFTAAILALDGMILVYSRTGLIDIFLAFFILLSFYLFLRFTNSKKLIYLILAGAAVGLAASVKYIGALVLIVFLVMILERKISFRKYFLKFFLFLFIVPAVIYLSFFLFNFHEKDFFFKVYEWHQQSFNYNIGLKDTHPYGSKWWSWFLLLRPIWLYFKEVNGQYVGVDGIGNPLAWWSSLVIVPLLIWGTAQKYKNHLIVLSGFLVFLLFWAPFNRVLFFYHAIPSFIFLSLGISLWLERLL